jgi:hypothetical protein
MNALHFDAPIVKIGILRSVIVPSKIVKALGGAARIPVLARYAGETTQSTLVPAGGDRRRLVLKMAVLRPAKLDAGSRLDVSLAPDASPRRPPLPLDLARALQFRPAAAAALDRASPSTWRTVVELLEASRTAETRQRRLERLVERLSENTADRATKV